MSLIAVRGALESALNDWSLLQLPVIKISYENTDFNPVINESFIKCFLIPADTDNPSLGDDHKRYYGIFKVLIYVPESGGTNLGNTIANSLFAKFERGSSFTLSGITVRILRSPSINPALYDDGWYVLPISIQYQSDIY
jgi:hypothetical protein